MFAVDCVVSCLTQLVYDVVCVCVLFDLLVYAVGCVVSCLTYSRMTLTALCPV